MNFSWYSFTSLSGALACFSICLFTYLKLDRHSPHRWFSLGILGLGFWCTDSFLLTSGIISDSNFMIHRILFFGAYLSQIGYILWAKGIKTSPTTREKLVVNLLVTSLIFMSLLNFTNLNFSQVNTNRFFSNFFLPGPFFVVFIIQCAICSLYGIYFLMYKEMKTTSSNIKIQLSYIILLSVLMYLAATNYFLFVYNVRILPITDIFVAVANLAMTYAIFRYQTMNIAIKKTLIYSTLITIITVTYFLSIFVLEKYFSAIVGYHSIAMTIILISFFSVIFIPLKNKIQRFFDKYFFRGSIDQIDEENTKLRDELEKSERLKAVATLAAGMAHEIKNPLTSIKTFTEYIDKKKNDPDFLDKFKEVVGPEVDRINHIVKQLLEFSKPSELELKDTNINDLLTETLDLLNNNLITRNIKVEKHLNDLPIIKVDPNQLKQVFLNLFLNAIEAINHNGTITVTTKPINSFNTTYDIPHTTYKPALNICIHDNGCGINKADIPKLFDPFYTRKDSGTGLGLSVVHGIIEKHHGKINVTSEIGKGTKFVIEL